MNFKQRLALCWRILRAEPGNLMSHALRELPPAKGEEMQTLMNQQICELVLVFSTHGHSGFSASYAINTVEKLLRYEPLRPLTGEDEEWFSHGYCVQNKRCSHVFKGDALRFNGGAYDIQGVVFREADGTCFSGLGSSQPIEFPYVPHTIYVDVDSEGFPLDGWDRRSGKHPEWLVHGKLGTA